MLEGTVVLARSCLLSGMSPKSWERADTYHFLFLKSPGVVGLDDGNNVCQAQMVLMYYWPA